jgi:hypothetical protein
VDRFTQFVTSQRFIDSSVGVAQGLGGPLLFAADVLDWLSPDPADYDSSIERRRWGSATRAFQSLYGQDTVNRRSFEYVAGNAVGTAGQLAIGLAGAVHATAGSLAQIGASGDVATTLLNRATAAADTQAGSLNAAAAPVEVGENLAGEANMDVATATEVVENLNIRSFGNLWRDTVANGIREVVPDGWTVTTEEWFWTPEGARFADVVVRNENFEIVGAIETKAGTSAYTSAQQAKDVWLSGVFKVPFFEYRFPFSMKLWQP